MGGYADNDAFRSCYFAFREYTQMRAFFSFLPVLFYILFSLRISLRCSFLLSSDRHAIPIPIPILLPTTCLFAGWRAEAGVGGVHTFSREVLLATPSQTHVLSTGTYCLVMTLMTSCATMPPVREAVLWSSLEPARTLQWKDLATSPVLQGEEDEWQ